MLKFLELYVIHCLGLLSDEDKKNMEDITPYLAKMFGKKGTWVQIIAAGMDFPPRLPEMIQQVWQENQVIAKQHNVTLSPQQFAEMFVDENLGE